MRVAVIGAGYVGLVTSACFAAAGHEVVVVERCPDRVALLQAGGLPIYEPGLGERVRAGRAAGRLRFTTDPDGISGAEVVFLCVGTPPAADGQADLTAFDEAAAAVAAHAADGATIASKSTVPVGTHLRLRRILDAVRPGGDLDVVSNPEFLKEGSAVDDFVHPDRVVVGATSPRAVARMRTLYAPFLRRSDDLLVMEPASAELAKYACNAMLAVRISFVNEVAGLCARVGAEIDDVRRVLGSDPRVGPHFLQPSLGWGGSCLPKDVRALAALGRERGAPVTVVEAAAEANVAHRDRFLAEVLRGVPAGGRIAVWGLAFKAGTDDVRESPALAVVDALRRAGLAVVAHDPEAAASARAVLGDDGITWADDPWGAVAGADALVVCTEWPVYRWADPARIARALRGRRVFDGRNLYDRDAFAAVGLRCVGVGRPDGRGCDDPPEVLAEAPLA